MVLAEKWEEGAKGTMKRVCIIRQKYYPENKNLRRNAEALVREGYQVDVICLALKEDKKRETVNGVNAHRISLAYHRGNVFWYFFDYAAFFVLSFLTLARLSLKERYDVVEVDTMPDFLVFISIFPRLLGSKVILYMFENMPALFISGFKLSPNHIGAKLLRFMEKASASYAHHVVVSDGFPYKNVLESRGIPSDKITVVLNVPDDAIFDPTLVASTVDGNHFRLTVVSTITERYGIQTLVKAVPLLVKDIPNLEVDIVGEGEYRPDLEKMAHDLGVERYLNFTGVIPLDDVPPYIARAHVGVAPMNEDVGAPNKLFEYAALGKPSVASALTGMMAVFEDNGVLYFQPGNEKDLAARILELYHNSEKRTSLGARAQAFYRKYHWPVMKHKYLGVYKQLLRST